MNRVLNSRHLAATALAAAAATSPLAQAQTTPVAVMNGTTLLGFDGIQFNNNAFDVRFLDGTCVALFDGCSSNTGSFMFTSLTDASAASQALGAALNQPGALGTPNGIASWSSSGMAITPYAINAGRTQMMGASLNLSPTTNTAAFLQGPYGLSVGSTALSVALDTAGLPNVTYAQWAVAAPVSPVPEAGTVGMMAVGLGAVFLAAGKVRRRRPA